MPKAIVFDADHDPTTHLVRQYRDRILPPILRGVFNVTPLSGSEATRDNLYPLLDNERYALFTGSGHGTGAMFMGQNQALVFAAGQVNAEWVTNMVIHLLSCECGQALGQYLVDQGSAAFFGYRTPFAFNDLTAEALLECDAEVVRGIARRDSLSVIGQNVINRFQAMAQEFNNRGGEYRSNVHLIEMMGQGFCWFLNTAPNVV